MHKHVDNLNRQNCGVWRSMDVRVCNRRPRWQVCQPHWIPRIPYLRPNTGNHEQETGWVLLRLYFPLILHIGGISTRLKSSPSYDHDKMSSISSGHEGAQERRMKMGDDRRKCITCGKKFSLIDHILEEDRKRGVFSTFFLNNLEMQFECPNCKGIRRAKLGLKDRPL